MADSDPDGLPDPDAALVAVTDALADLLQLTPAEVRDLGVRPAVSEASRPNDVDAHLSRVQRLLSDPALRAALRTVRETPQAWEAITTLVRERGDDLRDAASVPGDLHRELTPLLAGILLTPRARAVFKVALDRAADRESDELLRRVSTGRNFSRQAVVGAGWHGAVLASEMLLREPDLDTVTIEARDFLGGQFARSSADVHTLNSRTRPERPDLENLPGTRGSLNPMGMAPLQQSDVETAAYGGQARLGDVIAVNQWLATPTMLGQEVLFLRPAPGDSDEVEITLKDRRTGARRTTVHDRVILTSGLGEVDTGFDSIDEETQAILDREAAKPLRERRVIGYDDHIALVGDPDNRFPLQGWKDVAVIGPGDGGRIAIGKLTGHETDNKLSVPNLDWVEKIGWYGEEAETRQQFLQAERTRYARIGLEMPRPEVDRNYYSRVEPIDRRAAQLRDELDEDGRATGRIVVVDARGRERTYDHVILAPGFIDRTEQVLSTLQPRVYDSFDAVVGANDTVLTPGTRVTGSFGSLTVDRQLRVPRGRQPLLEIAKEDPRGGVTYETMSPVRWADLIVSLSDGIDRIEVPRRPSMEPVEYEGLPAPRILRDRKAMLGDVGNIMRLQGVRFLDGEGQTMNMRTVAEAREAISNGSVSSVEIPANRSAAMRAVMRYPVGTRCGAREVYLGGPAAKLALTSSERFQVPALERIPANTASGFRYVARDELLGGMLATRDLAAPADPADPRCLRDPGAAVVLPGDLLIATGRSSRRLRVTGVDRGDARVVAINGVTADQVAPLPAGAEWDDMVRLTVSEADEITSLRGGKRKTGAAEVAWTRESSDGGRAWTATVKGIAPKKLAAWELLLADPVLTRIADQTIDHAGTGGSAELRVPFAPEGVDLQRVSMSSRRPARRADREL